MYPLEVLECIIRGQFVFVCVVFHSVIIRGITKQSTPEAAGRRVINYYPTTSSEGVVVETVQIILSTKTICSGLQAWSDCDATPAGERLLW